MLLVTKIMPTLTALMKSTAMMGGGISSAPTMDRHSIADATIWHCSIIATIFLLHYRTMCHIATFPIYMAFSDLAWYGTIGTVYHWYTQTYYHDTQCEYKSCEVECSCADAGSSGCVGNVGKSHRNQHERTLMAALPHSTTMLHSE